MKKNNLIIHNIDKKILFELDKNSRIPITKLAKRLRISREIAKYRLKKLSENKVIKSFTTIINPSRLGFIIYKIYFKYSNVNREREEEIITSLKDHKNVFWLSACDGNYDLIVGVYVSNITEFDEFLSEINWSFGSSFSSRHISNSVYVNIYRRDYLSDGESEETFWGGLPAQEQLDETSKKILRLIAENSRMPISEICEKTGSAPKTTISKIKNMEMNSIILGYRINIDLEKIGKENFKAMIYFQNMDPAKEKRFKEFCRLDPNICYYIKTIGEWDLELDIEIEDFKKYNALIRTIKDKFGDIIKNIDSVYLSEEPKGELNIVQRL